MMSYVAVDFLLSNSHTHRLLSSYFYQCLPPSLHFLPGDRVWLRECWQLAKGPSMSSRPLGNQSSQPGSISWPATGFAGSHWIMSRPTATQGKSSIEGGARQWVHAHATQTPRSTNSLTLRYSVIIFSWNKANLARLWVKIHSCRHKTMRMLPLNPQHSRACTSSHFNTGQFLSPTTSGPSQNTPFLLCAAQGFNYGPCYWAYYTAAQHLPAAPITVVLIYWELPLFSPLEAN